jgi:hypothetical protein
MGETMSDEKLTQAEVEAMAEHMRKSKRATIYLERDGQRYPVATISIGPSGIMAATVQNHETGFSASVEFE